MFQHFAHHSGEGIALSASRAIARAFIATVAMAFVHLGSGCIAPGGLSRANKPESDPILEAKPITQEAAAPSPKEESLAAVEEFLQRTSQYRTGPSSLPGTIDSDANSATGEPVAVDAVTSPDKRDEYRDRTRDQVLSNTEVAVDRPIVQASSLAIPAIVSVSIATNDEAKNAPDQPETNQATNEPMDMRTQDAAPAFDDLLTRLAERAEKDRDVESHWRLRLAQLAADRTEEAMAVPTDIPESQGRLLGDLVDAIIAVRDVAGDPLLAGESAMEAVRRLRDTIADRADPVVSSIAFCRKVSTFGVFEEMDEKEFVSGRSIQTIVYSQIDNLRSQRTADDQFETRLATTLEVYSETGENVWNRSEPEIVDSCRRRRQDFFIAQRITLPPTLPAGHYILKVLVEDKLGGRASESSHEFDLFAPISVAGGQ